MLQQTQVGTVIDYFNRFVGRFADVRALAAADESEVLQMWAGLGYYSRARNLHRAARRVVAEHGGELPRDLQLLRALPGIGAYTVGAIASIAFGLPVPAVDGNVVRVVSRLGVLPLRRGDVASEAAARRMVAQLFEEPAALASPGDFTQALMELGATVCVKERPDCTHCPLQSDCLAYRQGRTAEFPLPKAPVVRSAIRLLVAWVQNEQGQIALIQRPPRGLWAGMWAPPSAVWAQSQSFDEAWGALPALRASSDGRPRVSIQRTLTHRDVSLSLYRALPPLSWDPQAAVRWVAPEDLHAAGLPQAFQVLMQTALHDALQPSLFSSDTL